MGPLRGTTDGKSSYTVESAVRGQSSVIGIVLLMAIVVTGTITIVATGTSVLADGRTDAQIESAEHAMTKFDATAALVALGESTNQRARVSLGGIDESLTVNPERGWMNVTIVNESSGIVRPVMNRTLGAVTYQNGDVEIAYQGGGVWKQADGAPTMISPPEFHYRGQTLTLPLITVGGTAQGSELVLSSVDGQDRRYPNTDANESFVNPLTDGQVNVTVKSDYYEAWGRFFEQRTSGSVSYDHAAETVTIELVVPTETQFQTALLATDPAGIEIRGGCGGGNNQGGNSDNGEDDCANKYLSGTEYPSVSPVIEERIQKCQNNNCTDGDIDTIPDNGATYYFDSSTVGPDTIDTTDGDITLVINGDYTPESVNILGNNTVQVFVRGDFIVDGGAELNIDGLASNYRVFIHEEGTVTFSGTQHVHGLIYAPDSSVTFGGTKTFTGSLIGETITVKGNPSSEIEPAPELQNVRLEFGAEDTADIYYLYVSVTNVNVTS